MNTHFMFLRFLFFIIFISFVFSDTPVESPNQRILPPIYALNIGRFVEEPSGLSFSTITGHLYSICDKPSCTYIYEMYTNGTQYKKWKISNLHQDIEAVAVDDKYGHIYIAEEENMRVTCYVLPVYPGDWIDDVIPQLIPISNFTLPTHGGDPNSGLEGLAIDTIRDQIYTVYEKKPRMYYTVDMHGRELNFVNTFFSGDLSGLTYDDVQDKVWIVSDQSSQIYITNVNCTVVFDYWDIPFDRAEGIAVNYLVDPPELYITTDPSSPSGPPYLPILAAFILPEIGTGLNYLDRPNTLGPLNCTGCDIVFEEINNLETNFNDKVAHQELIYTIELLACLALIFIPVIAIVVIAFIRTMKSYDPSIYMEPE